MNGYVYILGNPAFKDVLKIGRTTKDPHLRASELHTTGVPHPYTVLYFKYVENHEMVERYLHEKFTEHRENNNREFFRVGLKVVIDELMKFPEISSTDQDVFNGIGNSLDVFFHLYLAVSEEEKRFRLGLFKSSNQEYINGGEAVQIELDLHEHIFELHPYVTTITYALGSTMHIEKKKLESILISEIRSYHFKISDFYSLEDDLQTMKASKPNVNVKSDASELFDFVGKKILSETRLISKKNDLKNKNF